MQSIIDRVPLPHALLQAIPDELSKLGRPVTPYVRHALENDRVKEELLVFDFGEGWLPRRQLVGEAAERPDVDGLVVDGAFRDLRCDPIRGACPCLAVFFLLGEAAGEAEIGDLDLALGREEDVV